MEKEDLKEKVKLVATPGVDCDRTPPLENDKTDTAGHSSEATPKDAEHKNNNDVDNDDDLIGRTIGGHYEILSRIGSGGMSTVYKARHLLLDKFVAIKFILPNLIYDKQTARRFQQEAKASTELHHENICAVKEFEIHQENRAFLVMDYLDGKPLTDVIAEEGKLDTARALAIAEQICMGLSHAHSKSVIHRDIKPGNIVLVNDGSGAESVRIVDFGLAKLVRKDPANPNLTQSGEVFGTPNYMSPEQCLGRSVDTRSDIYSLGCLMHEMFLGKPPFQASSNIEVIMSHVNDRPELRDSNEIEAMILKCLEKSPDKRYSTADELLEDITSLRSKTKLVHAKRSKSKTREVITVILILAFSTITINLIYIGSASMSSRLDLESEWRAQTKIASQYIEQNRWAEAEESLEKAVDLAKRSKNQNHLSFSLSTLSNVEQSMGKVAEAKAHAEEAYPKSDMHAFRQLMMFVAISFIVTGVLIFAFFLFIFGPGCERRLKFWRRSLRDVLLESLR